MTTQLRPALVLLVLFSALCGLAYPLATTGIARLAFPHQAAGSLVVAKQSLVQGSELIGQAFSQPRYFHGRPSAAGYDASASTGSNLGPTSKALQQRMAADAAALRAENPKVPIPADLLTTSASGLDPDISPEAARFQIPRIAAARGLTEAKVEEVVASQIQDRWLDLFGEPHVNVLALNLALDALPVAKQF